MAKYNVTLEIIVEANSMDEAFANVRSNFFVADEQGKPVNMFVGAVAEVDDDADVSDYA